MEQPHQPLVLDSTPLLPLSDPVATEQPRVATSASPSVSDVLHASSSSSPFDTPSPPESAFGTVALATETAQPEPHDVDTSRDKHGRTALIQRAIAGDVAGVVTLLVAGNDVNEVDDTGVSAVVYAAACGHRAVVKLLVDAKASVAVVSNGVAALIQRLCGEKEDMDVLEVLFCVGPKVIEENQEWRKVEFKYWREQLKKTDETLLLLLWAARSGYVDTVKLLLAAGANVDVACCIQPDVCLLKVKTALILASERGHAQVVKVLLDSGADASVLENVALGALSMAIKHSHSEVVKVFLAAGHGRHQELDNERLLITAAYTGSVPMIHMFMGMGADIQARDGKGMNALDSAASERKRAAVKALLAAGADVNAMDARGRTALTHADNDAKIVQVLLDAGADMYTKDAGGKTPVHLAARERWPEVLACFLTAGADVETTASDGCTPLHEAAAHESVVAVQVLLAARANIEAKDKKGRTPLHLACYERCHDTMKKLIRTGANVNAKDVRGRTPLHSFCWGTNIYDNMGRPYIHLILSADVDVNAQDNDGQTPLHHAVGCTSTMRALLAAGADMTLRDRNGQTPLFHAVYRSRFDWNDVRLLIRVGADVNVKDNDGQTPLHIAATKFCRDTAKLLLRAGADVNARSNDGKTALSIACDNDDEEMIAHLLAARADLSLVDNEGQTALHVAALKRRSIAVLMILEAAHPPLDIKENADRHTGSGEDAKDEDEDEDEDEVENEDEDENGMYSDYESDDEGRYKLHDDYYSYDYYERFIKEMKEYKLQSNDDDSEKEELDYDDDDEDGVEYECHGEEWEDEVEYDYESNEDVVSVVRVDKDEV